MKKINILLLIAFIAYAAYFLRDKIMTFIPGQTPLPAEAMVKKQPKPEPKTVVKTQPVPTTKKEKTDYSDIILSQKCIGEIEGRICSILSQKFPRKGLDGAYSIAKTLYIALDLRNSHKQISKSFRAYNDKEKAELLSIVKQRFSRRIHPERFKKEGYSYKKPVYGPGVYRAVVFSDLFQSRLFDYLPEVKKFDEVIVIGYEITGNSFTQKAAYKISMKELLKGASSIKESDIIYYFKSGITDILDQKLRSMKL